MTTPATAPSIRTGRAMGTDVASPVIGGTIDAEGLFERIESLERRWTRFDDSSELSRLNAGGGRPVIVSDETMTLIRHMIAAFRLTGGRYDPSMLDSIRSLGYSESFAEVRAGIDNGTTTTAAIPRPDTPGDVAGRIENIELIERINAVRLPEGLHLDPGGIGKGLAADLLCDEAVRAGATGVLADVGGDIACRGTAPGGGPWRIALGGTAGAETRSDETVVELRDGAVATSEIAARSWSSPDGDRHHLLDPSTGLPLDRVTGATVIAGSAWWAEAMTKAALVSVAGADGWLTRRHAVELGVSVLVRTPSGTLEFGDAPLSETDVA